jgi:putative tricarboxylic transport membrane protein
MPVLSRRLLLAAATAPAAPRRAAAQGAPRMDQLRLFVPAAPGGGWDGTARGIEKVLRETGMVGGVQLEHVPGAGGTVGLPRFLGGLRGRRNTLMVSGLTLLTSSIVNKTPVSVSQAVPIARLTGETHVLVVPTDSPIRNTADFIAAFRADPRAMAVAGGSAGGTDHILLGMMGEALGIEVSRLSYVAFSGGGPAVTAILGSQVKAGISNWSEFAQHVEAGRMRAIGLSSDARMPGVDVPTLREGGIDAVLYNWRGVWAPPGIPDAHRAELEALVNAMAASPAWRQEAEARGWQLLHMPRAEFATFLEAETRAVEAVLKRLGLAS